MEHRFSGIRLRRAGLALLGSWLATWSFLVIVVRFGGPTDVTFETVTAWTTVAVGVALLVSERLRRTAADHEGTMRIAAIVGVASFVGLRAVTGAGLLAPGTIIEGMLAALVAGICLIAFLEAGDQ